MVSRAVILSVWLFMGADFWDFLSPLAVPSYQPTFDRRPEYAFSFSGAATRTVTVVGVPRAAAMWSHRCGDEGGVRTGDVSSIFFGARASDGSISRERKRSASGAKSLRELLSVPSRMPQTGRNCLNGYG